MLRLCDWFFYWPFS